jgi:hypothetical protein
LWEKWGLEILVSDSQALELCLSISSRPYVINSAIQVTRHALGKVFKVKVDAIGEAIQKLSSKVAQPSARNAIMLGVIAGVCAKNPEANGILAGRKSDFYSFYNREIIGSRTVIPSHVAVALKDFFAAFSTKEDVEREIIPSLEKALLRSPEIVLDDLLTPLFHSLPNSVDLSALLQSKLLKPLLSNIKSTSAIIRHGALSAFKAAVLKCHDMEHVGKITEEILAPLKSGKLSSADQRANHADMLAVLPVSKATANLVAAPIVSLFRTLWHQIRIINC